MLPFPDWMPEFVGKAIGIATNTTTGEQYFWGYVACSNVDWPRFEAHLQSVTGTYRVVDNPIYELAIEAGVFPQSSPEYFEGDFIIVKLAPPIEWLNG